MLTLLTTTGSRQQAWKICQILMQNQTYSKPVKWIIVDDGPEPQQLTLEKSDWEIKVIRPEPLWKEGVNTQARNLRAGLNEIADDEVVVIIEDDDYYHPEYLETISKDLDKGDLIGHLTNRYYHLQSLMYTELSKRAHSCLNATVIKGSSLKIFRDVCKKHKVSIDEYLWKQSKNKFFYDYSMVVGIKGIPGRSGIGRFHHKKDFGPVDLDHSILRSWIGNDIKIYSDFLNP